MDHLAVCDTNFVFDVNVDQQFVFSTFVPFIKEIRQTACDLYYRSDLWTSYDTPGSLLHHETTQDFKELRESLVIMYSKMNPSERPLCDGQSYPGHTLVITPNDSNNIRTKCDNIDVDVQHAKNSIQYQLFFRSLLKAYAKESEDFDILISAGFWYLDLGPQAQGRWDKTGYDLQNVRETLVEHLSYLNDDAIKDWKDSKGNDQEFSKRARVLLSRDEANAGNRHFPDKSGTLHHCRHHTKLNEDNSGKSAFYGGRLYFEVENRNRVFLGRVSQKD